MSAPLALAEAVAGLPANVAAWTTTRAVGSFGLGGTEPVHAVMDRWSALQDDLMVRGIVRLATATQVHGADVLRHAGGWHGWLRARGVDGHVTNVVGTALAVTIADCTPVFIAHPGGTVAALHAGWRGTAARILDVGLDALGHMGCPAEECSVHLGPSICGQCYEVGPEVIEALTGVRPAGKQYVDVRAVLAEQARARHVEQLTVSSLCTRCDQDKFYSHRGGDEGRQRGVIALLPS